MTPISGAEKQPAVQPGEELETAVHRKLVASYPLPTPESILLDGKSLYVTSVGAHNHASQQDNDAFLTKINVNEIAELSASQASLVLGMGDNAHALKGMAIAGNTLYAVDHHELLEIDLGKNEIVRRFDLGEVIFANDMVLIQTALEAYISITDASRIVAVDLTTGASRDLVKPGTVTGPNGLTLVGTKLYVVGWEPGV